MHSKSPVVNLAERHETLSAKKWVSVCNSQLLLIFKDVPIHLLISSLFYFIIVIPKIWMILSFHNNLSYISIFPQCRNWKWIATSMPVILIIYTEYQIDIINIFTELNVVCNWAYVSGVCIRSILHCKCIDFLLFFAFWCYRSLTICYVSEYYEGEKLII